MIHRNAIANDVANVFNEHFSIQSTSLFRWHRSGKSAEWSRVCAGKRKREGRDIWRETGLMGPSGVQSWNVRWRSHSAEWWNTEIGCSRWDVSSSLLFARYNVKERSRKKWWGKKMKQSSWSPERGCSRVRSRLAASR